MFKKALGGETEFDAFVKLALEIQLLCERDGCFFSVLAENPGEYFNRLELSEQRDLLWRLECLKDVCEQSQGEGTPVHKHAMLTWKIIKAMGFTPTTDCFGKFQDSDFIQIYNLRHQLVFASLNYFSLISYSLEELYCCPWMELFSRDEEITHKLFTYSSTVMTPGTDQTTEVPVAPHLVIENRGRKQSGIIGVGFFSPIYEKDKIVGFLSANQLIRSVHVVPRTGRATDLND